MICKTRGRKTLRAAKAPARRRRAPAKTARKRPTARRETADGASASLVAASARALGLPLDPAWHAGVATNLQLILRHAALVDEFVLPDEAEPAPVSQCLMRQPRT